MLFMSETANDESKLKQIFEEVKISSNPDQYEEIFTSLFLPGVPYGFEVSREELLDGTWTYRIYNFDTVSWRRIEPHTHKHLADLMSQMAINFNTGNDIGAQSIANKLVDFWKKEFSNPPHGQREYDPTKRLVHRRENLK